MATSYIPDDGDSDLDLDNDNEDNGGVLVQSSNQQSCLNEPEQDVNESEHSSAPQGDDSVIYLFSTEAQHPPSADDEALGPIDDEEEVDNEPASWVPPPIDDDDDENDDGLEINTEDHEASPPEPESQNEASPPPDLFNVVPIEDHLPGENDTMSAAVSPLDEGRISTNMAEDDDIVCSEGQLRRRMPYKVVRRPELFELGLPFTDQKCLKSLPGGFLTTIRGLDRAVEEFYGCGPKAFANEEESDFALLGMIIKRGGRTATEFQRVVYPEDIIPLVQLDGSPQEVRDEEYWQELRDQGRIWDEVWMPWEDDSEYEGSE
ncbi:uncharacterized protein Z520_02267 [Fonsecaea multimorphosa CBS 102226]|uniref:Uncharacterized protein n=1 Tax=Fonsecaea multimorphosa CBS 102226 TaxID=1442371 RepID=A0A0D2KZ93_9EURO|nr:uncharacterized protein Z520_02267 [Fonsecaea multimorphosa CBS 102226]KIY02129.1 hypothetical protein Z520_02267 [Fonsecaea multimorphosa CBS 102226]OAL29325.1 hypothetical protein AYO22_02219 [Fonsecaea multimorphosa]